MEQEKQQQVSRSGKGARLGRASLLGSSDIAANNQFASVLRAVFSGLLSLGPTLL